MHPRLTELPAELVAPKSIGTAALCVVMSLPRLCGCVWVCVCGCVGGWVCVCARARAGARVVYTGQALGIGQGSGLGSGSV